MYSYYYETPITVPTLLKSWRVQDWCDTNLSYNILLWKLWWFMLGFRVFILWPCVLKAVDRLHSNRISSSVCGHWWCRGRQTNKQQPWIMQSVVNEETRTVSFASLQRGAILCTPPHPQLIWWALQTLCVVMSNDGPRWSSAQSAGKW